MVEQNNKHLKMYNESALLNNNEDVRQLQDQVVNEREALVKRITILKRVKSDWSEFNRQVNIIYVFILFHIHLYFIKNFLSFYII